MSIPHVLESSPTREERPQIQAEELWARRLVRDLGIKFSTQSVCPGHSSQAQIFYEVLIKRPSIALIHGSRGAGKSYLSALETHISSIQNPNLKTRILGGSQAQSKQIYNALREIREGPVSREALITDLTENSATYLNGSEVQILSSNSTETRYSNHSDVAILSASSRSVRGPHVQSLRLDEVDEIPVELREAAMGMCMAKDGIPASVVMTSTWHRVNGSMALLIDQGRAGGFPLHTMCAFEVLETCPDSRSGSNLEKCPQCPLFRYCYSHLDQQGRPKAKRSNGHYSIDSLIQKLHTTSARTFESDYLCLAPRAEGAWFIGFDPIRHVTQDWHFDPSLPVHLAIDSGVFTGAVFFQIHRQRGHAGGDTVHVLADYLAENVPAEKNAIALREIARQKFNDRIGIISTDPAGGARNPVGPTVIGEYERAGLRDIKRWQQTSVSDGLSLIDSFLNPADGRSALIVHAGCTSTIESLRYYRRAKRGGQWQDYPDDPQHPHEDIVDALRGGLVMEFPEGRFKQRHHSLTRVSARQVF